jgi:integrase
MASITTQRGRLYVLGRFPCRDGSPGTKQTKLTLQLDDTPANLRIADKRLRLIERQLANETFDWSEWQPDDLRKAGTTWQKAINLLYEKKVLLGRTKQSTWDVSYMGLLKLIPRTQVVTTSGIQQALSRYERHQYSYKLLYYLLKDIALLTTVPFPKVGIPLYGTTRTIEVPNDDEIIDWVLSSEEPYRWYFGMVATYGLRPQETERCAQIDQNLIQVNADTKTGYRTVIPVHEEWVERFRLHQRSERPASTRDDSRPDAISQWLNKRRLAMGIEWRTYTLRHAYAARLWRSGGSELDIMTAARLMGHSVKEHLDTYRTHIDPNQIAVTAREAINRNLQKTRASLARQHRSEIDAQSATDRIHR